VAAPRPPSTWGTASPTTWTGSLRRASRARSWRRDFYDLHAICHHGLALGDLLADLPRKFGPGENVYHILKSLTYFDDAEADPEPLLRVSLRWEEVKAFFLREAPKYVG